MDLAECHNDTGSRYLGKGISACEAVVQSINHLKACFDLTPFQRRYEIDQWPGRYQPGIRVEALRRHVLDLAFLR